MFQDHDIPGFEKICHTYVSLTYDKKINLVNMTGFSPNQGIQGNMPDESA